MTIVLLIRLGRFLCGIHSIYLFINSSFEFYCDFSEVVEESMDLFSSSSSVPALRQFNGELWSLGAL